MAEAKPVGREGADDAGNSSAAKRGSSEGAPQVGAFFFQTDEGYRFCTGTVVASEGKDLVATAAHCFGAAGKKTNIVFVPQHRQQDPSPYGKFVVRAEQIFMDSKYAEPGGEHRYTDLDFAFLKTEPRSDGKQLEDVVGSVPLALNAGFEHSGTQVVGYGPKQGLVDCVATTKKLTTADKADPAAGAGDSAGNGQIWKGGSFLQADCNGPASAAGTPGGPFATSGAPFLIDLGGGKRGLAGVAGGFQAGTAGAKDTSYTSSYFDDDVRRVFDLAVAATRPVPEQPPAKPSKQGAPSQTPKPSGSAKPSAPLAPGADGRDPRLKAIEDFWTPERMAQAKPVKEQEEREARIPRPSEAPSSQGVAPRSPSHEFAGIPQVGTFFYQTDENYRFCAGTVVPSPGKNIIASAGHCFDSTDRKTNMIFVPQHNEKNPFPHGKFAIKVGGIFMDAKYLQPDGDHKYTELDFAFLKTEPRSDGKQLEDVVGSIPLALNAGFDHPGTRVIGYPRLPDMDGYKPKQNPLDCITTMKKFTTGDKVDKGKTWKGGSFAQIDCDGYVSGTSGGPFLIDLGGGKRGLAGVTGGFETGGHSANTSYSSYFDNNVQRVFDAAVAGTQPPANVLPDAETWKHAKDIANGYFALAGSVDDDRMDMFVMWTDGELSIYRGAGQNQNFFDKEFTVQGKNKLWADHAVQVVAGDFTGDSGSDLIVRWTDGEVTLYPSVDEKGFHGEVQLHKPEPDDTWQHAVAMTVGRFGGNDKMDDLVVRWTDGEVTIYQNTGTALGRQIIAVQPKTPQAETWKHAVEIGSGDYTGNDGWDLIVRWSDGEVTNYADFDGSSTWREHKWYAPNELLTHAVLVTGGDFSDNPYADDTIIRWTDGELSLYTDGDEKGLGKQNPLVVPAK
ncbi:trypsin-like serine protease [Streptomyces violascens]|uniref:trypsin-like serine protease n=1 Tax=Streptomyces violascens TaxID=67381 RepID=UPI0036C54D2C